MNLSVLRQAARQSLAIGALLILITGLVQSLHTPAYGARLGKRTLKISDSQVGAIATYEVAFTLSTSGILGTINIQFCSNDPLPSTACVAPNGFDTSSAVLASQSGETGFTRTAGTPANVLQITRPSSPNGTVAVVYSFTGVKNPTDIGPFYARLLTYGTSNGSGPASDYGGVALNILPDLAITAEVPPYLIFCSAVTISTFNCSSASGSLIDFGNLSATQTRSGSSQFMTATNAKDGYSVTILGSTMTSGVNNIPALTTNDVSRPGVGQFGLNLTTNSTPLVGGGPSGPGVVSPVPGYSQANQYHFVSGDVVVQNSVPDDVRKYTASYIVNIPAVQPPGIYVSTLTYICLANF